MNVFPRGIAILAAIVIPALGQSRSFGGVTVYTSSSKFFDAVANAHSTIENYEGIPINTLIPPGSTLDGITYVSFPAGAQGRIDNLYNHFGNAGLSLKRGFNNTGYFLPGDSFTVSFPEPVSIFGIYFNVSKSPGGSLYVNTPAGNVKTGGPVYDTSTFYFAGLVSDTLFSSATIGGTGNLGSGFNVDNLVVGIFVPEPSTIMLLAIALPGLLLASRLRKAA
jgi:hypothetical protein